MDFPIALLAVATLHSTSMSVNAIPFLLPCLCPFNSKPVCGSDGNTYRSECKLSCENYKNTIDIRVAHEGSCPDKINVALPQCSCFGDEQTVCASDGNTYANACELNCATATNPMLRLVHYGQCKDSVKEADNCYCPSTYNPVCGNDGNTYPNLCSLLCERSNNRDINVNNEGACIQTDKPHCLCPKELIEVCGSDGTTYSNPCELNCATSENPMLRILHFGKCSYGGVSIVEHVHTCTCPLDYKPVCGTDGKTYANRCTLHCQGNRDASVEVASEGPCSVQVNQCTCPKDRTPVCGSDGNSYSNPCELNCATINDPMLRISHFGKCVNSVIVAEPEGGSGCVCPRDMQPLCASDGRTYNNLCLMRCAGPHLSFIRPGPCGVY